MQTANVKFQGLDPNNRRPAIGLVNEGKIELIEGGIRLVGKRGKKLIPAVIGTLCGIVSLVGVLVLLESINALSGYVSGKGAFVVFIIAGAVPGAAIYQLLLAKLPGIPVDVRLAWSEVTIRSATRYGVELGSSHPALAGDFAFSAADPQSQAVLDATFNLPQTLRA